MPRRKKAKARKKKPLGPITLKELMRMSERQICERAYAKRRSRKPDASYSATGKLGPDDLKRCKRSEPPIEVIG
jgi:hypothetical protein